MAAKGTRKSHKSRKTEPGTVPAGGPSSTALATIPTDTNPPSNLPALPEGVVVTPPPAAVPERQWWYRPPDSKARKMAEKIVVMRAAGHPGKEIAKRLKTTVATVDQCMYIARKNGWLDDEDEPVDLEAELALDVDRKIVRNVAASLDGNMTNWQTHEMTIAAAKGRGIFKSHEVGKNDAPTQLPVVAIQVVMPPLGAGDQLPQIDESQMGGVPAFIEGETTEPEPENP